MLNVIKVLTAIVVIALGSVVQNYTNSKKNRRIRQFPLVILSVVLMAIGMALLIKNYSFSNVVIKAGSFFERSNLAFLNLILIVGFVPIKFVLRLLITNLLFQNKILKLFAFSLYQYDDEYDEWFLRNKWMGFRNFVFSLLCGTVIFSGIYLGLTWVLGASHPIWLLFFPVAVVVVLGEFFGYVNGQTKEEFIYMILGDEADSRRVSNYYKLREILEQILPEPLLSAHTGWEFMHKETPADLIKQLKDSDSVYDQITGEFFDLNGRYKTADVDCVQASLDMMHRRNVVFFNPFYKDLTMYITLPLVRTLLSGKKCVVLCGRKNTVEDVKEWITDLIKDYSRMKSLWRVNLLSEKEPECEVGILSFTQIYDKRIITTNKTFLNETDFVLIIEPSFMLNTSQVALSILAEEMNKNNEKPVYCICDRYTDGLVDTMSHLLRSEITDVIAMPVPRCNYTAMTWDADGDFCRQKLFDKQTRYLGNGTELVAIALKNQIPAVTWYSETKTPIKDVKWIAGQYHSTICRYMNQPSQQKNLYEKVNFVSTLWSSSKTKEQFVIAEDEFCNMFSVLRAYLSRGETQVFVNILSENYLLRDYMRCNRQVFMSNPNAVPSYVPDYAKTERNTILKLIIMMTLSPVYEETVLKELHLVKIDTKDAYHSLVNLLRKYTYAEDNIFTISSKRINIDEFTTASTNVYSISEEDFEKYFSDSLKNAYYILEEEKDEEGYIDAKMFSHVTQTSLPGQFVTYDGKYYQIKHISPQSGVVLRRASALYDGRKYYRQIRSYKFDFENSFELISIKKVMDIEFAEIRTDFKVSTTGYIEMNDNHDLRKARLIDFAQDPSVENYSRKYRNKSILRVQLPEADPKICFTVCLLLSEVFKTMFPNGWQYLAVVTKPIEDIEGMLNYVVYRAEGDVEEGYLYIVEDSDVDLGLLEAVEKNFMKLFEVLADFLEWHFEKMREPISKDPLPIKVSVADAEEKKKRGLILRTLDRIRRLFGGEAEQSVFIPNLTQEESKEQERELPAAEQQVVASEEKTESSERLPEEKEESLEELPEAKVVKSVDTNDESGSKPEEVIPSKEKQTQIYPEDELEPEVSNDPDLIHIDGTDIFDNEGMPEDNDYLELSFQEMGLTPITKTRYQKECYLKYGFEEIDGRIQIDEFRRYLRVRGWSNNALTLARKRDSLAKTFLDMDAVNHCDFCSLPLSGVSFERLNDGRIRCNDCGSTAITTIEDFREIFFRCLETMEDFYGIKYKVPISVKMTNAREIAKGSGMIFRPSTDVAIRALGFAQKKFGQYSLVVENGSPRLGAINTIVHEMTHIWQYFNWNTADIYRIYAMRNPDCTKKARDIVYEGMAMWASVQYLYQIGETYYAAQQEAIIEQREDVYGIGFRIYRDHYPLIKDSSLLKYSPFSTFPTVEPMDVINAVRGSCTSKRCIC